MRQRDLSKAADQIRKKMADAEADFSKMMAGQQLRWAKEEQDHTKEVQARQRELSILEEDRRKALEPVKLIEDRATKTLLEAQNALQTVLQREKDADDLRERLEAKLDDVGAREQDVLKREQRADALEKNLETQQRIAEDNMAFVARAMKNLQATKETYVKEMEDLKMEALLRDRTQQARAENLDRKEKELSDWAVRLKDERGILDRQYIRMGAKKKSV